ncbi:MULTISPECIES: ABC transporter ATP-binding protein [unclassified Kaistella]|uniref:ABC transporter ATP-binding protein n=1 Tax=unclassified Kaistella TaxID=2762626 RepID=UPI002733FDBC|nr:MULTISPECIES: ATP-binding cassette domain-containing protein [unclassified Kaistella]MCZ2083185.1 ATP-binding cassette domain-containing protein [Flavobacteriales bacterium]MDP2453474.1 ATP-binding cassette domain-containing protein [Kaistella sp. SH11-4b]MDP2456531.1 ATP-binding cassette domain-containing protein [Kaistella sp. SH40-3]MDP2459287.1 ATP-binding cassette domain-containing protein [Kaistella sp. SH19-2b]
MNNQDHKKVVLELKNLTKSFGDNHVLKGFNLKLYEGENLVVMGKSGSGKSVMVRCLVGLIQPDSGSISIKGEDIITIGHKELDLLRTEIGFLFQGSALYDSMTVRENLEFPLRRHKDKIKNFTGTEVLVREALQNVGLEHAIDLMPAELSGGMQRRVALARALILKPSIMMYDEPTTGLDPITAKEIIQLLRNIQVKYQTSSIIITHDVDCARVISNRMILLVDGINYAEGTFEELSNSEDPQVQAFFKN